MSKPTVTDAAILRRVHVAAPPTDDELASLHVRLHHLISKYTDPIELRSAIRALLLETSAAVCVIHACRNPAGQWNISPEETSGSIPQSADFLDQLNSCCNRVAIVGTVQAQAISNDDQPAHLICAPLRDAAVSEVIGMVANGSLAQLLQVVDVVAAYQSWWKRSRIPENAEWKLNALGAIIELVTDIERHDDLQSATFTAANALAEHLGCQRVAIAVRKRGRVRLLAVSGSAEFDVHSATGIMIEHALGETILREQFSQWPPSANEPQHLLLGHRQLAEDGNLQSVTSMPLTIPNGPTIGAWLFAGRKELLQSDRFPKFVRSSAPRVASALETVQRAQPTLRQRTVRSLKTLLDTNRGRSALVVTLLVAAVMVAPFTYRIRCRGTLQPVLRRYVVAPYEGIIERAFAESGDLVQTGDVLARVDGRDVRWELAGAEAEKQQAARKREMELSRRDIPEAQLAELEGARLDARLQLLEHRAKNMELVSPIDGVILTGSLQRNDSAAVTVGEVLYEVGPISPLKVEIAVPANEVSQLAVGQTLKVWVEGFEHDPIKGRLEKLAARSEIRDGENVFVAEFSIKNANQLLRPGMEGSVRIDGPKRPLAWNLFHKPWEYLQSRLTWW